VKVSTVTGAHTRDYIELRAQSAEECAQLVNVGTSRFIPLDSTMLLTGGYGSDQTVELRVFLGPAKQMKLDAETRDSLDAAP
jgi:hypothetical protein